VLRARDATRVTAELAIERGVRFVTGTAAPEGETVAVDGERLEADRIVWAGGAWLAGLFPDLVDLRVTRQDVYFFGAPAGWQAPSIPGWVDFDNGVYGVGDLDGRGFKASPDREGPPFDPGAGERQPSAEKEREARDYLALRFPALADAPLVGTRSCPYSLTEDTNFLITPHPEHDNVWLFGGGSGHGFKHGPALAEYMEKLLDGSEEPDEAFGLGTRSPGGGLRAPWIER
jgi:glycine/D-amino acid oxidase-like deaminating enzyme